MTITLINPNFHRLPLSEILQVGLWL